MCIYIIYLFILLLFYYLLMPGDHEPSEWSSRPWWITHTHTHCPPDIHTYTYTRTLPPLSSFPLSQHTHTHMLTSSHPVVSAFQHDRLWPLQAWSCPPEQESPSKPRPQSHQETTLQGTEGGQVQEGQES